MPKNTNPKKKLPKPNPPLWKGPEVDGVTSTLLRKFIECRERYRIHTILGLQQLPAFNHRIEFGNMWHACEDAEGTHGWLPSLRLYCEGLHNRYPHAGEDISHWYYIVKEMFPIYQQFWAKRRKKKQIATEQVFKVPYELPSGRVVFLRGKWDGMYEDPEGAWLEEHKTKGDIREDQITKQLDFDLQTMLYLTALYHAPSCDITPIGYYRKSNGRELPIQGVVYNVVRRPLSGGKGTIRQRKGESKEGFYKRLMEEYVEADPEHYFKQWPVYVTKGDVYNYRREFLSNILEQMCDWYHWVTVFAKPYGTLDLFENPVHWRRPFGCYSALEEGGTTDLDNYMKSGTLAGLGYARTVFPELEEL